MKSFKKVTAVVLSAAMILGSSLTAFAADPETATGTGNILDFKVVTQVVPTALKVAINPNGYPVNLRYSKLASDATYKADTKYYEEKDDGSFALKVVKSTDFDGLKAGLYTAATSTDQIVSFNYGLANKSTLDRKITVRFAVTADEKVTFVDTAAKATASAAEGDGGALRGEYKVFLQLIPAKAGTTPTTNTHAKATAYAQNTQYYQKSESNTYAEVDIADEDAFDDADYQLYVETTTIGTEIMASELGDITMDKSTAPIVYEAGTGTSKADVAYSLPQATYNLKADQFLDFSTSTADVEDKFEMTAIGGISGFTFSGVMNTNAAWSELTTKTFTVVPTYEFDDATGLEEKVTTGLNQIEAEAANYTVTYNANYAGADPATATESVAAGSNPTGVSTEITALKTREGYTFQGWFDAASDGEEVDVTELTGTATVYAHWEEEAPPAPEYEEGVAAVLTAGGKAYLALHGVDDAPFANAATSVIVNDIDVTEKAVLMNGYVGVSAADLAAAGVDVTGELVAEYTVDEVDYVATYTPAP